MGKARTAVIVDPDGAWRRKARWALADAGFVVVEASSAVEGLIQASSTQASIVATNYPMPMPDGSPFARVLTACPGLADAVVVATTADETPANIAAASADGCRVILVRPGPASALVEAVELALFVRR